MLIHRTGSYSAVRATAPTFFLRDHKGDTLLVEGRLPEAEAQKLRDMGHRVEVGEDYVVPTGGAQLIRLMEYGVRACGSDPRKDGCALAQ
jgi:gamma-glutamyltranspeptidase/glutathione hydrolase